MLPDDLLLKADKMSMAHSLELRVPLLDHEVVQVGLYMPDHEKVRQAWRRNAPSGSTIRRRLPPEIVDRPKQGFEVPIASWLREDLGVLAREMLAPERLAERGLLDPTPVVSILDEHRRGRADHSSNLYALLVLELWLAHVDSGRMASAA